VTSSISHKNAISEGVNPGDKGNAILIIEQSVYMQYVDAVTVSSVR
jgi:hypothetical protein